MRTSASAPRAAFSLIELLVVVAIIGVLAALLLPAVNVVRNSAAKLECANNLKQMGLAMHSYLEFEGCFPPARVNPGTGWYRGGPLYDFHGSSNYRILGHTAFTLLLPHLEHDLRDKFDFQAPSSPAYYNANWAPFLVNGGTVPAINQQLISTYVKTYHYPADKMPEVDNVVSVTDLSGNLHYENACASARRSNYLVNIYHEWFEYVSPFVVDPEADSIARTVKQFTFGNKWPSVHGAFMDNSRYRILDIQDGTSHTIAIGETKQDRWDESMNFKYPKAHWGSGERNSVAGSMKQQYAPVTTYLHINYPAGKVNSAQTSDPRYPLQDVQGFGSWHQGGANFLFTDGSVRFLPNKLSFAVYDALGSANGGETLSNLE